QCSRSGLFAYHLRYRGRRIDRRGPARHSHLRGYQCLVAQPAASGRQGDSVRLRLLRLLHLPGRRRCVARAMVYRALHEPADDGVPPSAQLFPPICRPQRCGSGGDGALDLAAHQSRQPAREYPADPATRQLAPDQRRKPPHRRSRAAKAMSVVRRSAQGICAGLLGFFLYSAAIAETPKPCQGSDLSHIEELAAAEAARADDLVNGDGLFWRIEKPGLAPSHLFGTIHSTDDSALEIARRAAQSVSGSKVVATELGGPIDTLEKANITAAALAKALDRDHDTFEGAIAPEDREK